MIKCRFPAFADVKAFRQGYIDTIYELSSDERALVEVIVRAMP